MSLATLLVLPVAIRLLGAGLSMAMSQHRRVQQALGLVVETAALIISVVLLVGVDREGPVAVQIGGWEAPLGITFVADRFAAIMLVVAAVMLLSVLVYAVGQPGTDERWVWFHPVYLVLGAGVSASFLTGDLFNLFVAFEVMLVASYVLLTIGGAKERIRAGMTYVVISLVASTLFITAVGLVYAATATVNLAQLSERVADLPPGLRDGLWLLLMVVFGIKAGVFPLFFWLPDSYPTAPSPVTAIFAGLLTKVGIYAMIRITTLLFPQGGPSPVLLGVAAATMTVGVLGALAQGDIKRILSFHIVSQIGYMVFGLGLLSLAGLAATIFYVVHHIVVKTSLFLVAGLVEHHQATSALDRLGGLRRRSPLLAALFIVPALSLAGLPPFSGFLAKLALVQEGFALDRGGVVAVSLVVSLLTLLSMVKIWNAVFWGEPPAETRPGGSPALMVAATASLVLISLAIAVAGGPLYELATEAAGELIDPSAYGAAVLGTVMP